MRAFAAYALVLCLVASIADAAQPPIPPLSGPVVDTANVIASEHRAAITALARELEHATGAELAVLTVASTAPLTEFDYGLLVLKQWQLGKKDRDNGLLLLVAVEDRRIRFFTGYGLEGILPDGRLGAILDEHIVPALRAGDIGAGLYAGVYAAASVIAAEAGVQLTGVAPPSDPRRPSRRRTIAPLLPLLFMMLPGLLFGRRRRRGLGYPPIFWGGGFGGGLGGMGGGFGGRGGFGGGGAGRGW